MSDDENNHVEKRRDDALRRALQTPPKPNTGSEKGKRTEPKPRRSPALDENDKEDER